MHQLAKLAAVCALSTAGFAHAAIEVITFDVAQSGYTPGTPGQIYEVKDQFASMGVSFADQKTPGRGAIVGQCGPGEGSFSLFGFGNDFTGCGDTRPDLDVVFNGYTTFFSIHNYDGLVQASAYDASNNLLGTTQTFAGDLTFSGIGQIARVNLKSLDQDPTTMDTLQFETVVPLQAIPEPSTYALMALGLAAVGGFARRRGTRTQ